MLKNEGRREGGGRREEGGRRKGGGREEGGRARMYEGKKPISNLMKTYNRTEPLLSVHDSAATTKSKAFWAKTL